LIQLDIITVNWNSKAQLEACLDAVAASSKSAFRLGTYFVVDNASSDQSLEAAKHSDLPIQIIHNSENLGFGAACNQAFARTQADMVLLLNPDTRIAPDSLDQAVACLLQPERSSTGILGIQLADDAGQVNRSCARFPGARHLFAQLTGLDQVAPRLFPGIFRREWDHRDSREVDHVMGSFYLVRRALLERLQGFDERFFMYLEDLDFSLRAAQAGWGSFYLAEARALHHFGGASQQIKAIRLYYYLASRVRYANKHLGRPSAWLHLAATMLVEPVARIVQVVFQSAPGRRQRLRELARAFGMLWKALPDLIE
jgi:hypothetical protein